MEAPRAHQNIIESLVPVRSGQTQLAVEMLQTLNTRWVAEHLDATREHGILHASWYLAILPGGAYILAHLAGDDAHAGVGRMIGASSEFAGWLRQHLSEVSGFSIDERSIQFLLHVPLVLVSPDTSLRNGRGSPGTSSDA